MPAFGTPISSVWHWVQYQDVPEMIEGDSDAWSASDTTNGPPPGRGSQTGVVAWGAPSLKPMGLGGGVGADPRGMLGRCDGHGWQARR